jgi:hypothetical protein
VEDVVQALAAFADAARGAVAEIERVARGETSDLERLSAALACVYAAALALPSPAQESDELIEVASRDWEPMYLRLKEAFTPDDFREFFEPFSDKEPVGTSVSQELVEIWQDLTKSLEMIETHPATPDLVWQVRFDCTSHWVGT